MGAAKDLYSNRTLATIVQSALNTITFEQIRFAAGLFEGLALVLNRIHLYPTAASLRQIVAATDHLTMALVTRDDLTSLDPTNLSVLASKMITGIAAGVERYVTPLTIPFSDLPGKGLLIPANPLYMGVDSGGFTAVATVRFILEYQWKKLTPQENLELLQTLLPGTV